MDIEAIRKLNDDFRQHFIGGKVVITNGVTSQGDDVVQEVLRLVQQFNNFTPENDPYGEHDFGDFIHKNIKYFWKIDYYNLDYNGLSEDTANPEITNRVLTILLAEEY